MSKFISVSSFRLLPLVALMPASLAFASEPVQPAAPIATLPTTVVTASRIAQPIDQVIGDISVIERAELERYSGESVLNALQLQAGVQILSNGGAGKPSSVSIRGANSSHTLVLIDGVKYSSLTTGTAALEHLPVDQIERIEILRGPAASLYGSDAIGGVIQIFTRQGNKTPSVSLTVGAGTENTQQASVTAGGKFGETHASVTIAHSKTDGISAVSSPAGFGYNPDKDGYENSSFGLNLKHKLNQKIDIGFNSLIAQVDNQYDSGLNDSAYNDGYNGAFSLWSSLKITPHLTSELKLGRSVDDSDSYSYGEKSSYKTDQTTYQLQNTAQLGQFGTALLSLERLEQGLESSIDFAETQRNINSTVLGYIFEQKQLSLQANLRHDRNSQFDQETTYSAGAGWRFLPTWQVGGLVGTGFKAPTFSELYWPEARKQIDGFVGNPDLRPETSQNYELFVRHNNDQLQSSLTLYRNDIDDLLTYQFPTTVNINQALIEGVTLQMDWQNGLQQIGGSYSFVDAKDQSGGVTQNKQLTYRAKHSGVAYFGLQQEQLSGRVELQAVGSRYTNPTNTQRVAGYTLVNLSGSVEVTPELKIGLRVNNLFDEQYESIKDYGTLGTNGLLSLTYTPKL